MMSIILSIPQALQSVTANPGDPSGILYGTDPMNAQVVTIDTGSGIQTPLTNQLIGAFGAPGLAFDKVNGVLYMTDGSGQNTIYTVETVGPNAGEETAIGIGFGNLDLGDANVNSLDFDNSGTLYGSANLAGGPLTGADHLVTINTATGLATIVGPFGACSTPPASPADGSGDCDIEGMEAIGFDSSNQLWGIQRSGGGLYQINSATGAATFFASISNSPSGGIVSMEFACDGTIYVGTHGNVDGELGIVTIVGNTASYTSVGGATASGNSLGGLAFDTACQAGPGGPGNNVIGGDILPINTVSLLLAGMQTGFAWILPVALSAVGIGALVIRKIRRI